MSEKKKSKKTQVSTAIVLREMALSERQTLSLGMATPQEFIKTRKARGGKEVRYIEGGYVISRLNTAFSPVGWDFEVISESVTDSEVWAKGKLTIRDHKNGYSISKTQYGQHERAKGVPLGDTLKAAATDAMKKCATMIGIGLDVYWVQGEEGEKGGDKSTPPPPKKTKIDDTDMVKIKKIIMSTRETNALFTMDSKIKGSTLYTAAQKAELGKMISTQVDKIDNAK